jgi:hypothetical protein
MHLSFWDRIQLRLLRVLSIVLGLVDKLFDVEVGEKILSRLAARWQSQLAQLDQALEDLAKERRDADLKAQALSIYAAALYLGRRRLARGELLFNPTDAHDEEVLDASIELLVKERLADIEPKEVGAGRYTYRLDPDWLAIRARLSAALEETGAENDDWLRDGLRFIDDALLPEIDERVSKPYQE